MKLTLARAQVKQQIDFPLPADFNRQQLECRRQLRFKMLGLPVILKAGFAVKRNLHLNEIEGKRGLIGIDFSSDSICHVKLFQIKRIVLFSE